MIIAMVYLLDTKVTLSLFADISWLRNKTHLITASVATIQKSVESKSWYNYPRPIRSVNSCSISTPKGPSKGLAVSARSQPQRGHKGRSEFNSLLKRSLLCKLLARCEGRGFRNLIRFQNRRSFGGFASSGTIVGHLLQLRSSCD